MTEDTLLPPPEYVKYKEYPTAPPHGFHLTIEPVFSIEPAAGDEIEGGQGLTDPIGVGVGVGVADPEGGWVGVKVAVGPPGVGVAVAVGAGSVGSKP